MSTATTPADVAGNSYLGKTRTVPRPTEATHGQGAHLERIQGQWDAAEQWAKENDRLREERLKKIDADRKAKVDADRKVVEEQFVDGLRRKYLAADPSATEAEFAQDLPEIRRRHRIEAAIATDTAADEAARRANAARYG